MVASWDYKDDFSAEHHEEYLQTASHFLASNQTTRASIEDGKKFHEAAPDVREPSPLTDNVQERLEIAMQVQNVVHRDWDEISPALKQTSSFQVGEKFQLNLLHLSMFLCLDINILRGVIMCLGEEIVDGLSAVESLLGIFLQRNADKIQSDSMPKVSRKNGSRDEALHLYGSRCAYSRTPDPDNAYIWPFAVNSNKADYANTRLCFRTLGRVFGSHFSEDLCSLFAPNDDLQVALGCSDYPWNMIPTNTQGHQWWGKAYFGLKWAGALLPEEELPNANGQLKMYTRFNVEWYWLPEKIANAFCDNDGDSHGRLTYPPQRQLDFARRVRLDPNDNNEELIRRLDQSIGRSAASTSTNGATMRDENGRLIESGRVFTLIVESKDLDKAERCIKHQWLMTRVASLSGAGETPDDLDRTCPPPDYDISRLPTLEEWGQRGRAV